MDSTIDQLKKKYEEHWIPEKYLQNYMLSTSPWEAKLTASLHECVNQGKVKGPRGIDIGCGPTVHRMAIIEKACDEILACDYTQSNIDFVKKFLEGECTDDLGETLQAVAKLKGYKNTEEGAQFLAARLRSKVKDVVQCDLTNRDSVNNLLQYGGQFDCAISNGCLESACLTYDSYVAVLKRIFCILRSGAAFALSGYLKGNFYNVDGVNFECLKWDADMVRRGLREAGFMVDTLESFEADISNVADLSNCSSVFFSLSYKP